MKKKILIIRFSSIGDIVLTTPVVRNIQEAGHEVHYLTKEVFAPILISNPRISKVYKFKNNVDECLPALKNEAYDYVVDLHKNIRSSIVKRYLSCPSYSFNKLNIQKWIFTNFHIDLLPDLHIVDRYNSILNKINVPIDQLGLEYYIPDSDEMDIYQLWKTPKSRYISLAIGAAHFTKRIPVNLAIDILEKLDLPVVIIGGKEDAGSANKIIVNCQNQKVISMCGKLNFHQSASIIRQSIGLIAPDTGMMHIGAALKKPIVCIWGNTVPKFGMYPYYGNNDPRNSSSSIEIKGLSCRPCSKIGYESCPKKHFNCMNQHDSEVICNALLKKIGPDDIIEP